MRLHGPPTRDQIEVVHHCLLLARTAIELGALMEMKSSAVRERIAWASVRGFIAEAAPIKVSKRGPPAKRWLATALGREWLAAKTI